MEKNNKTKEIDVKNCICCYFDDIININNLDLDKLLLNEKAYENILWCCIFDDRVRCLILLKINISDIYSHKYMIIKIILEDDSKM